MSRSVLSIPSLINFMPGFLVSSSLFFSLVELDRHYELGIETETDNPRQEIHQLIIYNFWIYCLGFSWA